MEAVRPCQMINAKNSMAKRMYDLAMKEIQMVTKNKMNLIWLEVNGCSGNIISLLNGENPDVMYLIREMTTLRYNNSLMTAEGDEAFEKFLKTLDNDFILVVEGAVATRENGLYQIVANLHGKKITGMDAVRMAGEKAKYVIAVGTCASYGGTSAANPNPSGCISVPDFLDREVIRLPGCPCHPDWIMGTIAHIISFGMPELDEQGRPQLFYNITIHDRCTRRSYFDQGIFASKFGDPECMFKLGCRGPITKTDCPVRQWNGYVNWPVEANTTCIGCAGENFPDGMEPFVRY